MHNSFSRTVWNSFSGPPCFDRRSLISAAEVFGFQKKSVFMNLCQEYWVDFISTECGLAQDESSDHAGVDSSKLLLGSCKGLSHLYIYSITVNWRGYENHPNDINLFNIFGLKCGAGPVNFGKFRIKIVVIKCLSLLTSQKQSKNWKSIS